MSRVGETKEDRERRVSSAARVGAAMLHEVRNVLNPIVSAAFLLDANANDPAKVRELAARIEGFAKTEERIASKLRELLDRERSAPASAAGASYAPAASSTSVPHP